MKAGTVVRLVARREVRERGRSREMAVSTVISLVVIAVLVLVAGAGDDGPSYDVGTVGERPAAVAATLAELAGAGAGAGDTVGSDGTAGADGAGEADDGDDAADGTAGSDGEADDGDERVELAVERVADRAEAERRLADGDLDAVLVDDEILVEDDLDRELESLIQAAHREVAIAAALADAGATPDQVAAASPRPLATRALDPGADADDDRVGLATIGTFLLFTQLFGFGYWVASGIVEEKASRVIEVLLAKAGPRPLLAGKILGLGLVGLAQLVLFVGVGLGLAAALGTVELPPGTLRVAVELIAWFLVGFVVYACVFAMGGAIASRVEELQGTTGPITLVAMGGFFAALAAGNDPEGVVAQVATFVPVAAPMVLPIRSAAGALPAWQAVGAVALVLATAGLVVRLAARVYAGGALFTRGQLPVRDALARAGDG
ncbi:MAG TPA: ABC transporter permease [Acidimicrobiales bacterium]